MSRFAHGRASRRLASRPAKCAVRPVVDGTREAVDVERDNGIPTRGFCHECEVFVDEAAGKLHRATCTAAPERRRAS